MFCKNCGARIDDDSLFCDSCGAPQGAVQPAQPAQPAAPKKKPPIGLFIGIGAGALAVIVAVILIIALAGGGGGSASPEKLVKNVVRFYSDLYSDGGDSAAYLSFFPDSYLKKFTKDNDLTMSELKKKVQKKLDQTKALIDAFASEDYAILDYEVKELRDVDEEDIEKMARDYDLKITDAKIAIVSTTVLSDGETDDNEMRIHIIKVGGKWYIEPSSLEDLLE